MTLTEKQEKVQLCETNLVRRTVGVKRADKRTTNELRVEVRVQEFFKKKLARSSLTWAGHAERDEMKNWQREQMLRKWRGKEGNNYKLH